MVQVLDKRLHPDLHAFIVWYLLLLTSAKADTDV